MKGILELTGMEFHAYHGCLPEERVNGTRYLVDVKAEYDISKAAASDNLEDALDYGTIHDIVKAQMSVPSNLIEHVAARILDAVRGQFPEVDAFEVKLCKENPPVNGQAQWSKITLRDERN